MANTSKNTPTANELTDFGLEAARAIGTLHETYGEGADGEQRNLPFHYAAQYLDSLINASHDQLHGFTYGKGARVEGMISQVVEATVKRQVLEDTDPEASNTATIRAKAREEIMSRQLDAAVAVHKRLLEEWAVTQDDPSAQWVSRRERKVATEKARANKEEIEAELRAKLGA